MTRFIHGLVAGFMKVRFRLFRASIDRGNRKMRGVQVIGGERGIRTLDTRLTYTPLAGERLQPLGHLSGNMKRRTMPLCRSLNVTTRRLDFNSPSCRFEMQRGGGWKNRRFGMPVSATNGINLDFTRV